MKPIPSLAVTGLSILLFMALPAAASDPANTGRTALADSAETAYSNPAGMVRMEKTTKTVQGILAYGLIEFDVDESKTTVDGGNPDSDHTPIVIPAFYYVKPVNDEWYLGFSMNIPSGFGSDYGSSWAGRYFTDSFTLVYVGMTPSVAYKFNEHLSLGASLNATYTYSESEARINNPGPGQPDGKFQYDGDDLGFTGTVSMMYQWNSKTRMGMSYTGETDTDVEGDLRLKGLGPILDATIGDLDGSTIKVKTVLPQKFSVGIYHELESGKYVTADALWIDFSEFGTGKISIENNGVFKPEGIYKDIYGLTLGIGIPMDSDTTIKFGAMYFSEAVSDSKRTLSLRLDRIIGVGTGISQKFKGYTLDTNFNIYNMGDASVDTGNNLLRGRVAGESDTPWGLSFDIALHW